MFYSVPNFLNSMHTMESSKLAEMHTTHKKNCASFQSARTKIKLFFVSLFPFFSSILVYVTHNAWELGIMAQQIPVTIRSVSLSLKLMVWGSFILSLQK